MDQLYAAVHAAMKALVDNKHVCRWTALVLALAGAAMACFEATFPFFGMVWGLATCLLMVDFTRWLTELDEDR
jgi:hypothetical protein